MTISPSLDAFGALSQEIEQAAQADGLTVEERIGKLRMWEEDLTTLLGRTQTYIGDLRLAQEARDPAYRDVVMEMRQDADIREALIERGIAPAEELDALGLLSHEDIDRLAEEALLDEWVAEVLALSEAGNPIEKAWDAIKHPRGAHGKWTDVLGRSVAPKGRHGRAVPIPKPPRPARAAASDAERAGVSADRTAKSADRTAAVAGEAGTRENPIDVGDDIEKAAKLLGEGKHVVLNQPRQVSTLLDRLSRYVADAQRKGEKAPTYDLCRVSVKGTNLFCAQSKGIDRLKMPQLEGTPTPGSRGDALPRDAKGRVNLGDLFVEHLREKGVKVESATEKASYLRASQAELDGAIVARIANEIETKGRKSKPIFVSRDNYIVDGHHNWAATVGVDLRDNKEGDLDMPIQRIDMSIADVLDEARQFAASYGVESHGIGIDPLKPTEPAAPNVPGSVDQDAAHAGSALASETEKAKQIEQSGGWVKDEAATSVLGDHPDTQSMHSVVVRASGGGRVYSPERQQLHDQIIDTLLRQRSTHDMGDGSAELRPDPQGKPLAPTGDGPRVLMMGGGSAAGKSTVLALPENQTFIPEGAVHIDPDEIKTMLPEYGQLVANGSRFAAAAVHEESSDLAGRLRQEAIQRGLNVILDGTGDSSPGKTASKIRAMRDAGYDVHMLYVNAPTAVAAARNAERASKTGRFVPEEEVRNQHRNVSARFQSDVLPLIEDGTVSHVRMYHTDPTVSLMAEGGGGKMHVHDEGLYQSFLDKANE